MSKVHHDPALRRKSLLTLANKITILRIILIPAIVIGLLKNHYLSVTALVVFSMLTEFLDGLAARRRGERTDLGAFLDPMADKLLLTALFMTYTYLGKIDTWVFVIIFSRDLLIVLGWGIIHILTGSSAIIPRSLGKVTTAAQMATAVVLLWPQFPAGARDALLWLTVAITVISAFDYVFIGEKRLGASA